MKFFEVAGKKVLVMGAARSGIACESFWLLRGATVALNDAKAIENWSADALALKNQGVGILPGEFRVGCLTKPSW